MQIGLFLVLDAFPSATQNELNLEDAKSIIKNGLNV